MRAFCSLAMMLILLTGLLTGCGAEEGTGPSGSEQPVAEATAPSTQPTEPPPVVDERTARINAILDAMTEREKIEQLFIISLGPFGVAGFDEPSQEVLDFLDSSQPGGYIFFTSNFSTKEKARALTDAMGEHSKTPPFIAVDEEGGIVSRLASAGLEGYVNQNYASAIGRSGDTDKALQAGTAIGETLAELGFNLDFAPVADVLYEPSNTVIGSRSYGSDPELVADMASAFQQGLLDQGLLTSPKHFPGHGGTKEDSHDRLAILESDGEHLDAGEYVPFRRLIAEGCAFVMLGHIAVPKVDPSGLPASLSPYFARVLREDLGFGGILITDAMNMTAVTGQYPAGEAAVMALSSGMDMVLMPEDFGEAAGAVAAALADGTLSRERMDASLRRIIGCKLDAGIID